MSVYLPELIVTWITHDKTRPSISENVRISDYVGASMLHGMQPDVLFSSVNSLMKTQGVSEILNMEDQTESIISSDMTVHILPHLFNTHLVILYRP